MEPVSAEPKFRIVADQLTAAILRGDYKAGAFLPTETQLAAQFAVSRDTIRSALQEVRTAELIETHRGRGNIVKATTAPDTVISRSLTKTTKGFHDEASTVELEPPTITRCTLSGEPADLLHVHPRDEAQAFSIDRLLRNATGVRVMQRVIVPFDTAADADMGDEPATDPAAIYAMLAQAGHTLSWHEQVTARAPRPDERTTLAVPPDGTLLITHRVTTGNAKPLILETLKINAAIAQLRFQITATRPRRPKS
ncbi:GntR family transcriptional regulator [Streptomyces mayteni]